MRNWNDKIISVFPVSPLVTSLPMRNWNCETVALRIFPRCYQPTYEELKLCSENLHLPCTKLPAYLWGIETRRPLFADPPRQPTYEELKQLGESYLPATGYQPTYEELKPFWFSHGATKLPAYLWELKLPSWINTRLQLPAYLWGIETGSVVHRIK